MKFYRPTFAEIDLGAIQHNLSLIKSIVGDEVKILGVVKADAYGHGMKQVARVIEQDVDYLGVASLDEARQLREADIKNPIVVLGPILPEEIEGVGKFDVIQTVSDIDIVDRLAKFAEKDNRDIRVHLKIDTGMGRIGVWHEDAMDFVKKVKSLKRIVIDGIFTHFPSAEDDRDFTDNQINNFKALIKRLDENKIKIPFHHTSNSAALVDYKSAHMNMVRPGLVMYGLYPRQDLIGKLNLKPALTLKTKVVYIKSVPKGRSISYGRTHVVERDTKIATIPVGYGDGYSRHLSNKAVVLIRGKRAPIAGRVCMDMCMVDVGHIDNVQVGDEVVLIGLQGKEKITVEELAGIMRTIPYEVVCNIGRRVPRVYSRCT